jgi:hypothetical protein
VGVGVGVKFQLIAKGTHMVSPMELSFGNK